MTRNASITITLDLRSDNVEAVLDVIDNLLDAGEIQSLISEGVADHDDVEDVHFISSTAALAPAVE